MCCKVAAQSAKLFKVVELGKVVDGINTVLLSLVMRSLATLLLSVMVKRRGKLGTELVGLGMEDMMVSPIT